MPTCTSEDKDGSGDSGLEDFLKVPRERKDTQNFNYISVNIGNITNEEIITNDSIDSGKER